MAMIVGVVATTAAGEEEEEVVDETSILVLEDTEEGEMNMVVEDVKRVGMEVAAMSMVVVVVEGDRDMMGNSRNMVADGKNTVVAAADTVVEVIHTVVAARTMAVRDEEEGDMEPRNHMARADNMDTTAEEEEEADKTTTVLPVATTAVTKEVVMVEEEEETRTAETKAADTAVNNTPLAHPMEAAARMAA